MALRVSETPGTLRGGAKALPKTTPLHAPGYGNITIYCLPGIGSPQRFPGEFC